MRHYHKEAPVNTYVKIPGYDHPARVTDMYYKAGNLHHLKVVWDWKRKKGRSREETKTVVYHAGMKIVTRKSAFRRWINKQKRLLGKLVEQIMTYAAKTK